MNRQLRNDNLVNAFLYAIQGREIRDAWQTNASNMRLIREGGCGILCLALPAGAEAHCPSEDTVEGWNDWIIGGAPDAPMSCVARIGRHLWIYAEVPEKARHLAQAYLEAAACLLVEQLKTSVGTGIDHTEEAVDSKKMEFERESGFGAAAIVAGEGRPLQDLIYEAWIDAATQLRLSQRERPLTMERLAIAKLLRERALLSVYQPIMRLGDGGVYGYEALSRCSADSGFDGPLALFTSAEREGYAFELDRLAREKAIQACPELGPDQKIFINISMGIMNDSRFVSGQTVDWLKARGLHPGLVVFELTERSSIDDFPAAQKILGHYRSQGYEIAIDDAGAGYSSLQSIVELKPDYIKIDKSLVQHADRDEMKEHMLRTFSKFAERMNIRTIAEGIERPEELELVQSVGIDFGQGYLIGRPKPSCRSEN